MDILTIIAGIVLFLFLITIHEGGHFFGAKSSGIKVNEFSIGMGPSIFKKKGKETLYSLRALPIGGYVMMEGEEKDSDDERSFNSAKAWKRFITIFAGPAVNLIFAVIIFTFVSLFNGHSSTEVAALDAALPAYKAGLKEGDIIKSVNGVKTNLFVEIAQEIEKSKSEVKLNVSRDGKVVEIKVNPVLVNKNKVIGFKPKIKNDILSSIAFGYKMTVFVSKMIINSLVNLFTGKLGMDNLSGPIGVVRQVGESAKLGLNSFLMFSAMISINLGIFNLIPIPALDGSKLLFIIFEMITGKRVNKKFEEIITIAGFVVLMAFMLFVTVKDIGSIF